MLYRSYWLHSKGVGHSQKKLKQKQCCSVVGREDDKNLDLLSKRSVYHGDHKQRINLRIVGCICQAII